MLKRLVLVLLGVCLAAVRPAGGQTIGGSLEGTVTDPSGAAVPRAQVLVLNVATGDARTLATDDAGRYRVPLLPPGEYEVRATAAGFRPILRRGAQLAIGETL